MTPGLCKACDALAPRTSQSDQNSYLPIKECAISPMKEDGDDDSQNHIIKEDNIESDLQSQVPMEDVEFGTGTESAWIHDVTSNKKIHSIHLTQITGPIL